uniref:Uncharacterized protein n=1 Tax=Arion vulgaris TaxID=1028688 RepID=A0A0B7AXS4_9EUPU
MPFLSLIQSAYKDFFEYSTPMIVQIQNTTVGIINRSIQLVILFYIIGYAIIYEKGYQEYDTAKSAVATKVKGIIYYKHEKYGEFVRDVADYVIPPQETNALFIVTAVVPTYKQTHGACAENPSNSIALCDNDTYCEDMIDVIDAQSNGPFTGKCVPARLPGRHDVCEVFAWCPVEEDDPENFLVFPDSANFTLFIKNNIEFPVFGLLRRNIRDWYKTDAELASCRWDGNDPINKYCPIFLLGDIANSIGEKYSSLLKKGGIMQIAIDWNCDLDFGEDYCLPEYSFKRLDKGNYSLSVGFNFRYADHYFMNNESGVPVQYRNLFKVYGIHFLIEVRGKAGRFCFVPLMMNIGSGMALLAIASVVCDILVLNVLKARHFYKEKKFLTIKALGIENLNNTVHEATEEDTLQSDNETANRSDGKKEDEIEILS